MPAYWQKKRIMLKILSLYEEKPRLGARVVLEQSRSQDERHWERSWFWDRNWCREFKLGRIVLKKEISK